MAPRSRRRMALVAVAALCMGVPACGRSVSSTQGQGSGLVSPTKGLVATTPAGTKPVQSVTWAVYRDVNSLDPIFAFDYPENTADSLMCESLLLQAPGGDDRLDLARGCLFVGGGHRAALVGSRTCSRMKVTTE